jgi:mono/diheme cytochrome c family protein
MIDQEMARKAVQWTAGSAYDGAMSSNTRLAALFVLALSMGACTLSKNTVPEDEAFFVSEVKPILERNCLACHSTNANPSRLNLSGPEVLHIGRGGKRFIVPGKPDESLIVTAISRRGGHANLMPRVELSLTEDQVGIIREWIENGAAWPTGAEGRLVAKANAER